MSRSNQHIVIVCAAASPRLEYVCNWIFSERFGLSYKIVTTQTEFNVTEDSFVLHYGMPGPDGMYCTGLLTASGIPSQEIKWDEWCGLPAFFVCKDAFAIPFDLLAAVFYLISRYEEYTISAADRHGRFDAQASCLYTGGVLERPLVDEWLVAFSDWLTARGVAVRKSEFSFLPTYDIDIAWSYKHKGILRNTGGLLRDITRGAFAEVLFRLKVLSGKIQDPYDSFGFLDDLHRRFGLSPVYFILLAQQTSTFDKNIHPAHPAMSTLVRHLKALYRIGIHPSYKSSEQESVLQSEQAKLKGLTGLNVQLSRQHYIRFRTPDTFRMLLRNGITEDFSTGYGTHFGFRAGTGNSFRWYDIEQEAETSLRITPFCFMDTTARYELQLTAEEAFNRLSEMRTRLKGAGGSMVTIFHNFSLGSDPSWKGWPELYGLFIQTTLS